MTPFTLGELTRAHSCCACWHGCTSACSAMHVQNAHVQIATVCFASFWDALLGPCYLESCLFRVAEMRQSRLQSIDVGARLQYQAMTIDHAWCVHVGLTIPGLTLGTRLRWSWIWSTTPLKAALLRSTDIQHFLTAALPWMSGQLHLLSLNAQVSFLPLLTPTLPQMALSPIA